MSAADDRAWEALQRLSGEGVHVVRDHRVGPYNVAFAVRKLKLAIEIDSGVPGGRDSDAERQAHLESQGWSFLRIPSRDTYEPELLLETVRAALPASPRRNS